VSDAIQNTTRDMMNHTTGDVMHDTMGVVPRNGDVMRKVCFDAEEDCGLVSVSSPLWLLCI
jgi:hypothetical protein